MASSCSTFVYTPLLSMKVVPYVPQAPKPKSKPKSKAKSMATTKMAEHSRLEAGSSKDGEWFHIDDFPMPDSNASRSLDPVVPAPFGAAGTSSFLDHDVVGGLGAASEPEKPEHYQSGRESLDGGGTDHAESVMKTNSVLNRFDGSSLEFPLILESDIAEEHRTTQVKPSNGASDYQGNGYHAATGSEGYRAGQDGDLDAASMRALSVEGVEGMEGIRHEEPSPAEDEPIFDDVDVTTTSPLKRKRTRRSSSDTIISSAKVPDITSEPKLEEPRLAKRQRPSERQAESLILDHVPTPKPTPLPNPSSPYSRSRTSNEPSPDPLDNDNQGGGAGSLVPSPKHLDDDGIGESHEDGLSQADEMSGRPLAKSPQRSESSDRSVQKRRRGLLRTTLRRRSWSTMPTRILPPVTSYQPSQLSKPRMDSATWSCSQRTCSPGTKARDGTNKTHGSSANMAYQITDLTHCHVLEGSSIVTAIMRCSESNLSLNSIALNSKLLGGEGKLIRMTQLSPNSWILLGYRRDDSGSDACNRESLTLLNADRASSPFSDTASDDSNHPDDGDEDEESLGEYRPHGAGRGHRLSKGDMRFRKRTRVPWLESDEERLLSYKDKMGMEWKEICKRFPDRSPGAIKLRYHILRNR